MLIQLSADYGTTAKYDKIFKLEFRVCEYWI